MKEVMIRTALKWSMQRADFECDGTLRDIYIDNATVGDWQRVLAIIMDGKYGARLRRRGADVPVPANFESLFDGTDRFHLYFTVGGIRLDCHFFAVSEIEFSFPPTNINEGSMCDLLAFIIDIGDAAQKSVILTPENLPDSPIFRYDPLSHHLTWIPPNKRHG